MHFKIPNHEAHLDIVYGENKHVNVILFGWFGANHKHVLKYANMINKNGYTVAISLMPVKYLLVSPKKNVARFTLDLFKILETTNMLQEKFVLMSFSNGGSVVLNEAVNYDVVREKCVGIIMDSGPAIITQKKTDYVINDVFQNNFIARGVIKLLSRTKFKSQRQYWMENFNKFKTNGCRCQELYFGSNGDRIADLEQIRELVDYRRELGVAAKLVEFDNSPHVSHLRTYPKEYEREIILFLEAVE